VRLRPDLEITVDEYWSRVIGVYVAVGVGVGDVDVVHPTMMVTVSIVMLLIRRIRFRFRLVFIFCSPVLAMLPQCLPSSISPSFGLSNSPSITTMQKAQKGCLIPLRLIPPKFQGRHTNRAYYKRS